MRVSTKLPAYAKLVLKKLFLTQELQFLHQMMMMQQWTTLVLQAADAWPANIDFDATESNFSRIQLCAGFRDVLVELNDPQNWRLV